MMPASNARGATVDRRRLIIDAARSLFATRPYDQVTTAEIARNAGVAYGLIAHHFDNKRGLYMAVVKQIADEIAAAQLATLPRGASLLDQLRHALRGHIAYIDSHSDGFVPLMRGALGADAEHRAAIENSRWAGAQRLLAALGIAEPYPPTLRTAMHGWVGYLDEMMIDRITHGDIDTDSLVDLAVAALVATLRTAATIDPAIDYPAAARHELDDFASNS